MKRLVSPWTAALATIAAVLLGAAATTTADDAATVEVVNLSADTINWAALVPAGQAVTDATPNALTAALAPKAGVLLRGIAPGSYALNGVRLGVADGQFASDAVALRAGDVLTLTVEPSGGGVKVSARAQAAGSAALSAATYSFSKRLGEELPPKAQP